MTNKKIIKNSTLLYLRMFISMCVSFFTTRVVLDVLGVDDYGLKNVVGGFVTMFTYFNSVMQGGGARYIALYLGKNDLNKLRHSFNNSVIINVAVALLILLLTESFGLYFLNYKLNIKPERIIAANWIYQLSILTVILEVLQTPYKSIITAYERFSVYAYLSIFDVILKLIVVYLLLIVSGDKLIIYTLFLTGVSLILFLIYIFYTRKHFEIVKSKITIDKVLLKEMIGFSAWTALGNLSAVLNGQGINVLLNIFLGTVLNASRAISDTIVWIVKSFSSSVLIASMPQLTKLYGANKKEEFLKQINDSFTIGTFLLSLFAVPVICEIDFFLQFWLKEVPPYTSIFVQLVLFNSIQSYANTILDQSITASGNVKILAMSTTLIFLSYFPIAYVILKLKLSPVYIYIIPIIMSLVVLFINLYILKTRLQFSVKSFIFKVYLKTLIATAFSITVSLILKNFFEPSFIRMIIISGLSVFLVIFTFYFFVLTQTLREQLIGFVKMKIWGC